MAEEGTFCGNADVEKKVGANASATSTAEAYTNVYIKQAECLINNFCRFNYLGTYSTLNADVKLLLQEVASNIAAIYAIIYDMSGYTSRVEAEDMVNVLRDAALRGLSLLRDKKTQDFINGA